MSSLRERLEAFDRLSPDDSLLERARSGPRHDPPGVARSAGPRVAAATAAIAVFVAAAVFAENGLRGSHPTPTPSASPKPQVAKLGQDGSVLWPLRTRDALQEAQTEVVQGHGKRWLLLLDPRKVVKQFADTVLGWPKGTYTVAIAPVGSGELKATLTRKGVSEEVILGQPVPIGAGSIWVVVEVRASSLEVDVAAGGTVINGNSVKVRAAAPTPRVVVGGYIGDYHGFKNCAASSGTGLLRGTQTQISVFVAPDRLTGTDCGDKAPGYVWAASSNLSLTPGADPLNGDWSPYVAVTAVPVEVAIPQNTPAPNLRTYTGPNGWRADFPSSWKATRITGHGRVSIKGVAFSNFTLDSSTLRTRPGFSFAGLPTDGVVVAITQTGGTLPDLLSDDTGLPVTFACDLNTVHSCQQRVRGNGIDYTIWVQHGTGASASDLQAAESLVRSLGFPSLRNFVVIAGWTSLGPPNSYPVGRGTPTGVPRLDIVYVMRGPQGTYVLDLKPDGCGEGESETWDPKRLQIWLQCPGYLGMGDARFDRFGNPDPRNNAAFSTRLLAYPVIKAWNGDLLVYLATPLETLPSRDWP